MPFKKIIETEKIEEKLPREETFWAWLAGFWEGEGYFGVYNKTQLYKNKEYVHRQAQFGLDNNSEAVLKYIKEELGVGEVYKKEGKTSEWCTHSKPAIIAIGKKLIPHLRFRKEVVIERLKIVEERWNEFLESKNLWREDEIKFIGHNWKKMTDAEIAKMMGRTKRAVMLKREKEGLIKSTGWHKKNGERSGGSTIAICDNCRGSITRFFSGIRRNRHNFCSQECRYKWLSKHLSGKNSPSYKQVDITCDYCKKGFSKKPSHLGKYHNFCSRECFFYWKRGNSHGISKA